MKISEESFDESDVAMISDLYKNHIGSYWRAQALIVLLALVNPYCERNTESIFSDEFADSYWSNVLVSLTVMTILWIGYFYYSKRALRRDVHESIKEVYAFEVLKKERLFQDNSFYVFVEDHQKHTITEELYESIDVGDELFFHKAKYSGELLSITASGE